MTLRLQGMVDQWHAFTEKDLVTTAMKIREEQIDLLFDLAGHTPGQSLMLFASRPAPVQCTYLGYPNTTGLPAMDYRLVDAISDPPGLTDASNTEKLIRLPQTAWCFQPSPEAVVADWEPPVVRRGYVTFGSFNALCKMSDALLRAWAEILRKVPTGRLLVKNYALHDLEGRESFQRRALTHGLPLERIDLLGGLPEYLHFQSFRMIDVMLDTFPYHGTTTTCEALWMGVPVVTLAGKLHVSRVGASLLNQVQGDSLVARSLAEYIERAVALARNIQELRGWHGALRQRMSDSPLLSATRFARDFEAAIEQMIQGEPL